MTNSIQNPFVRKSLNAFYYFLLPVAFIFFIGWTMQTQSIQDEKINELYDLIEPKEEMTEEGTLDVMKTNIEE